MIDHSLCTTAVSSSGASGRVEISAPRSIPTGVDFDPLEVQDADGGDLEVLFEAVECDDGGVLQIDGFRLWKL